MSKSSVSRYFSDFKDDGVCISSSNISTKSYTRRRSSCEIPPMTTGRFDRDINENRPVKDFQYRHVPGFEPVNRIKKRVNVEENTERSQSLMTLANGTRKVQKFKYNVNFDSDEDSDSEPPMEISDVTVDSEKTVSHIKNKCCRRLLRWRNRRLNVKKLPYRVKFKLIVMSLKCLQVVFALLWTLTTYLQPHLNHWIGGRFKWIGYIFFGLYFFLYFMVRFIGCFHEYWKLVTIFVTFTLSIAHVTATMSISTGDLIMPVILGLILFIGLNYILINLKILDDNLIFRQIYKVGVSLFITAYLCGTVICIYMGSLHVEERTELNKQMASVHCALIIGAFYGVYIIYEIRMFLDNQRLALDGVIDDYILAAVVI